MISHSKSISHCKSLIMGIAIFTAAHGALAGDKIGNGGGAWACETSPSQILNAQLVDLFEAQNEFSWQPLTFDRTLQPMAVVDQIATRVDRELTEYAANWRLNLQTVKNQIQMVNVELVVVDDALFRARPLPSTCPSGSWQYVQFANFTNLGQVEIRNDLWAASYISNVSKAALIWHEAVYLWMRTAYQDTNSIRARYIVGVIFSDMSPDLKKAKIASILQEPPPSNSENWICALDRQGTPGMNDVVNQVPIFTPVIPTPPAVLPFAPDVPMGPPRTGVYVSYGSSNFDTKNQTLMACQKDGDPRSCFENNIECEQITSSMIAWECRDDNTYTTQSFLGRGRSLLEAKVRAKQACMQSSSGDSFFCLSRPPECQSYNNRQ